ncbi:hypothetical protein [Marinoscillum furvescens]|uniref:Lipoprotein n=1 Tax=Marinoscillum furvescens DSM 4134 TaxID=1122208 RepID=A0A3D9KYR2_MARFU|nr:hypothetical protein [Marinoscillum furvescens]RED93867.1 hypothetical protein C7460_12347 [Marinoscillum furvescens DSM 4134]
MNRIFPLMLVFLSACYSTPEIDGFDAASWEHSKLTCKDNRLSHAELLVSQQEKLLGEGQAEIKTLLGQPTEHELYNRNQKFFYYSLIADDDCIAKRLSVRFDALDRVKEIRIIQ